MRVLKYVLLVLVLAVAAVYAVGSSLPEKYSVKRSIYLPGVMVINVWNTLSDVENSPKWNPSVSKVELIQNPKKRQYPVYRCQGGGMVMDIEYVSVEDYQKLVGTILNSDELGFGGEWVFELSAEPTGTRLTITENGFVKNPFWRFLSQKVMKPETHLVKYLEALALHLSPHTTTIVDRVE